MGRLTVETEGRAAHLEPTPRRMLPLDVRPGPRVRRRFATGTAPRIRGGRATYERTKSAGDPWKSTWSWNRANQSASAVGVIGASRPIEGETPPRPKPKCFRSGRTNEPRRRWSVIAAPHGPAARCRRPGLSANRQRADQRSHQRLPRQSLVRWNRRCQQRSQRQCPCERNCRPYARRRPKTSLFKDLRVFPQLSPQPQEQTHPKSGHERKVAIFRVVVHQKVDTEAQASLTTPEDQ